MEADKHKHTRTRAHTSTCAHKRTRAHAHIDHKPIPAVDRCDCVAKQVIRLTVSEAFAFERLARYGRQQRSHCTCKSRWGRKKPHWLIGDTAALLVWFLSWERLSTHATPFEMVVCYMRASAQMYCANIFRGENDLRTNQRAVCGVANAELRNDWR